MPGPQGGAVSVPRHDPSRPLPIPGPGGGPQKVPSTKSGNVIGGQLGRVLTVLGPVVEDRCPGVSTSWESISSEPAHTVPVRTGPDGGAAETGSAGRFV